MIEAILESFGSKIGEYKQKIARGAAIGTLAAMPFIFSQNAEASGVGKYLYDANDVINVGSRKYTFEKDIKEFEIKGKSAYLIKTEEDAVLFFWLGKNAKKQYAARSVRGKPVVVNKDFSIRADDGKQYRIYPNGDVKRVTTTTTWEDNRGRTVKKQVPYEKPSVGRQPAQRKHLSAEEYKRKINEDYRKWRPKEKAKEKEKKEYLREGINGLYDKSKNHNLGYFLGIVETDPGHIEAWKYLAKSYELNQKHGLEDESIESKLKNKSDELFEKGEKFYKNKNYERAEELFAKGVAIYDDDPDKWNRWGDSLFRSHKHGKALKVYKKCTIMDPQDGNAWGGLGVSYIYHKKDKEKAYECIKKGADLGDNSSITILKNFDKICRLNGL
ncbi:hypothetical protein GF336_01705 [Candidatus Woesearchaeota archaeon]|nr:hypothetical protein [Candidatus Woesearchaeota archaeon]